MNSCYSLNNHNINDKKSRGVYTNLGIFFVNLRKSGKVCVWGIFHVCARCIYIYIYIYYDGKIINIPRREFIFRTCEDRVIWHLIPRRISPYSESFLGHIGTGILCGGLFRVRLTAAGKGFPNFTLHVHPPGHYLFLLLEQWKIWISRFDIIILIIVVDKSGFPYNIFKGKNRTI